VSREALWGDERLAGMRLLGFRAKASRKQPQEILLPRPWSPTLTGS
jgi:hypothetical protein